MYGLEIRALGKYKNALIIEKTIEEKVAIVNFFTKF